MNMLKAKLNKKLGKNGGFTLVEMLIVVAIIAILVAVSIPLVSSSLEKAREATDDANERAAKAVVTIAFLSKQAGETATLPGGITFDTATAYIYNAETGALQAAAVGTGNGYGKASGNEDNAIAIGTKTDGEVVFDWVSATTAGSAAGLSFT